MLVQHDVANLIALPVLVVLNSRNTVPVAEYLSDVCIQAETKPQHGWVANRLQLTGPRAASATPPLQLEDIVVGHTAASPRAPSSAEKRKRSAERTRTIATDSDQ